MKYEIPVVWEKMRKQVHLIDLKKESNIVIFLLIKEKIFRELEWIDWKISLTAKVIRCLNMVLFWEDKVQHDFIRVKSRGRAKHLEKSIS